MDVRQKRLHRPAHPRFQSQSSTGFTLLELMVVVLMLGILSAIALPSFLRQANRAREAEAKISVGQINQAQQLYFVENFQFGSLDDLEIVKPLNSRNYTYRSVPSATDVPIALTTATPNDPLLRGFAGKVWIAGQAESRAVSQSILCKGDLGEVPEVDGELCP
jgi:type IV pilus assembly protein PilA